MPKKNKQKVKSPPRKISQSIATTQKTPDAPKKKSQSKNFFLEHWRQLSVISLLALALYIESVGFNYVLDDTILIVENKFTQKGIKGIGDIFQYESFRGYFGEQKDLVEGGRYRPLTIATFALEKSITGGKPWFSHLINILFYVFTGILLYRVLLFMFPRARSGLSESWFFSVPFVATVLFIVHPLHIEVVGNVKGRDELFAFLGEMGGLYFTFKYLEQKRLKQLVYSFLCFFIGILSKESVLTFLAIVPLTAYFFFDSSLSDKIKVTLPIATASIIYIVIRVSVIGHLVGSAEVTDIMNNPFYGMTKGEKMATIFYTLLLYLKLLIYPHPLTHDYYPYHIPIMHWNDWRPILSVLLYLGLVLIFVKGFTRKTVWAYAVAFYLVALSIVSNLFISIGTFMNERFVYHASLGFCIAAAWLLVRKVAYTSSRKNVAFSFFVAATIGFSILTLIRLPDWRTIEALDKAGLRVSPNSARANHFYAVDLWTHHYLTLPKNADSARRRAVLDSINPYFERALQILPSYSMANSMKAGMAAEYHKLDHDYPKLIKAFEEVNRTHTYEKFVLEYLRYVNKTVNTQKDAKLLAAFYVRMIDYYNQTWKNTTLPADYGALLKEIQDRIPSLP
jgi:protein O-mannosyl-transferase